jgi:putative hydrolase of the HAD superfamily
MVLREPRLRWVLKRLPGPKLVYSNAPVLYARAVLKLMQVDDLFDDVFAIEHARFRPKPESAGFRRLLRKHRLHAALCGREDKRRAGIAAHDEPVLERKNDGDQTNG